MIMSFVSLFIGQCGNQIGNEFLSEISINEKSILCNVFTTPLRCPRAIFIDSETKVVRNCKRRVERLGLNFCERNLISAKYGRGCNWALGYTGLNSSKYEEEMIDNCICSARREAEKCDKFSGFLFYHSLSGGTGSGLTCRLMDELREEFQTEEFISCCVAPDIRGSSSMQYLNSLLCLNTLQMHANCVVIFRNDVLLNEVDTKSGNQLENINKYIASCLSDIYLPNESISNLQSLGSEPSELIRRLICKSNPNCKLLTAYTSDTNNIALSWNDLAVRTTKSLMKNNPKTNKKYTSLAVLTFAKGLDSSLLKSDQNKFVSKINSLYNCSSNNNYDFVKSHWSSEKCKRNRKSLTVIANHCSVTNFLSNILDRTSAIIQSKAYLHWYEKYYPDIITRFNQSTLQAENIIQSYEKK